MRSGATCTSPRTCCSPSATATNAKSPPPRRPTPSTAEAPRAPRWSRPSIAMTTTSALFYIFSAVLLASSFGVITARSTVHAALFLVLAFFNAVVPVDDAEGRVPGHHAGARLRRRRHGAVPVRGDDAGHQHRGAARGLLEGVPAGRARGRADRARDGAGADGRLQPRRRAGGRRRGRASWATPACWASRSTPTTCTRCRSRPCCCWWPSSPPSRSRCASARTARRSIPNLALRARKADRLRIVKMAPTIEVASRAGRPRGRSRGKEGGKA